MMHEGPWTPTSHMSRRLSTNVWTLLRHSGIGCGALNRKRVHNGVRRSMNAVMNTRGDRTHSHRQGCEIRFWLSKYIYSSFLKKRKKSKMGKRIRLSPLQRLTILSQQSYCCVGIQCQGQTLMPPLGMEIDHVIPLHRGGSNAWENLAALCATCHAIKTNMEIERSRGVCDFGMQTYQAYQASMDRCRKPPSSVKRSRFFPALDPCPAHWHAWRQALWYHAPRLTSSF